MTQSPSTVIHASNSTVWIPTENEWYKAAYYDPSASGPADDYWLYPTRSDSAPTIATAGATGDISNPGANVANYNYGADWNAQDGNVTTVGSAGPLSASYYGTYDQGGNVWEWNEAKSGGNRGLRGASWIDELNIMPSTLINNGAPTLEDFFFGFRLASSVPEPSRAMLLLAGACASLMRRRRHTAGI